MVRMKRLTPRERILAVLKGEQCDRVPFVQYDNLAADNNAIWDKIGRQSMGVLRWLTTYRIEHPNCATATEPLAREGLAGVRTTIATPRGILVQESYQEPTYGTSSIRKHFVTAAQDYDALLYYLQDAVISEDLTDFHRAQRELGENGLPLVRVERTPYQQLWVQWTGIENLALHLFDVPERVQDCIVALSDQARQIFKLVARQPIDIVNFPDNITAPVIGESNFRRYCLPLYAELNAMLAGEGKPIFVHMDGDLKPLWQAIGESAVGGLDSFSPPPDNDTSAAQAVSMWPQMRIFLNFPSSVHLGSKREIYRQTCTILEEAGHSNRLQIQISENVPPGVWQKSFPQIVKAIADFGQP